MKITATYSLSRHRFPARKRPRNHNLEEQAQALFKSWFVDFEPFKNGKFVESELGLIPEGWRVGAVQDFCNVFTGKKDVNQSFPVGKYPFFSCSPTHTYSNEAIYDGEAIISPPGRSLI